MSLPHSIRYKALDAQSGTGESTEKTHHGNVYCKHNLSITTSTAGSALTIELIDKETGQEVLSHAATSTELSDKAFSVSADGYPLARVTVNVAANTGAGDITIVYTGSN